jgi:DNA-directed RNA polymerase specialized sigma24 family protein
MVVHPPVLRRTFPPTRASIVAGLTDANADVRALAADVLARGYWGPVVALLALRWRMEPADAEDVAQEFFAAAFAKDWLARYEPSRGRFRTFLRTLLDRFAADDARARSRLKRGGGAAPLTLDDALAVAANAPDETDARIHAEWVRSMLQMALDALRAESASAGKSVQVAVFEAYDVVDVPDAERPTYRVLAERFAIADTQVTNYLNWARRAYRRHVLDTLRAFAGSDAEFREDASDLLGGRKVSI